ncbi:FapA family protein [Clostridium sp.]|uniref:FapA family protein n=1 Tax=Clostridium sp. TaxID=1506 RepID=UPI00284814B1|nr:FapA family protein [Clostridium sp.]MDR3597775.1 FapA family protein [Clostridium sp.]
MEREVGAKVVNGEIIVIDGINKEKITIKARKYINLVINDTPCKQYEAYEVTSKDKLTYTCEKTKASREINISISDDKMKAYITVQYTPEIEYKLKDKDTFLNLAISTEIASEKYPEYFTVAELKKILKEKGIVYGIKEEELEVATEGTEGTGKEILIAEGKKPIKDIPSEVKLFFTPTQMMFPEPDSDEIIDYKNLFRISNVNSGDKIAEIIPEVIGEEGMNIFGKVIKREYIRSLPINASDGCKIEGNDIIALIDGKAHIANRKVTVNPIYAVESVNMETCNIRFHGDIEVYDSVQDNMFVSAGGSLDVSQNVNTSSVVSGGEITILGNAINSKILSGQIDIRNKEYLDVLNEFKHIISEMVEYINELKIRGMYSKNNDLIITLTEQRFSNFQKIALNIVSLNIKNKTKRSKLVDYIKENILGYNILNMKDISDLICLKDILENEIEYYDRNLIAPLDIRIGYCQDCEIKSTGNIIMGGKGEYTSKLTAMKDILFTNSNSVARGGVLSSGENISAGIVGSKAYIPTTLIVPKHGRITAALTFPNTILCFGNVRLILEETMKNISVHYNEETRRIIINNSAL